MLAFIDTTRQILIKGNSAYGSRVTNENWHTVRKVNKLYWIKALGSVVSGTGSVLSGTKLQKDCIRISWRNQKDELSPLRLDGNRSGKGTSWIETRCCFFLFVSNPLKLTWEGKEIRKNGDYDGWLQGKHTASVPRWLSETCARVV